MDEIIQYLKNKYDPITIIIYGSYADGTKNENSDFDALVISKYHENSHDLSVVEGIQTNMVRTLKRKLQSLLKMCLERQIMTFKMILNGAKKCCCEQNLQGA